MLGYPIDEKKIHDSIVFLINQSLQNPILRVEILQHATQEIINEIDKIHEELTLLLNTTGLRHDQFELKDICETSKEFLVKLIMNCGFQEYRGRK